MPDVISLITRTFAALIYALVVGWKLTLVFLSVSPLIIIMFNMTIKVNSVDLFGSVARRRRISFR